MRTTTLSVSIVKHHVETPGTTPKTAEPSGGPSTVIDLFTVGWVAARYTPDPTRSTSPLERLALFVAIVRYDPPVVE